MTMKQRSSKYNPWYRPRNVIFMLLGVVMICFIYLIHWAYTAEPNPKINYAAKLEQLSADAQPPGENAWPILKRTYAKLNELDKAHPAEERCNWHRDQFDFAIFDRVASLEVSDVYEDQKQPLREAKQAVRWLNKHRAFDLLAQAANCPRLVRPVETSHSQIQAPAADLRQARRLANARSGSFQMALHHGNGTSAIDAVNELLGFGYLYAVQPLLIESLVGSGILQDAYRNTRLLMQRETCNADDLESLLRIFRRHERDISVDTLFKAERLFVLDRVQHIYTDDGNGNGTLLPAALHRISVANNTYSALFEDTEVSDLRNLWGLFAPDRRTFVEHVDWYFQQCHELSQQPGADWLAPGERLTQKVEALSERSKYYQLLPDSLHVAVLYRREVVTRHRGIMILLAIELYHARHGRYPQALDELTSDLLDELPEDRVSGQPFVYQRLDDDPHDRAYLLYSVGLDGVDNNGHAPRDNPNAAFHNYSAQGNDYVFNRPLQQDVR